MQSFVSMQVPIYWFHASPSLCLISCGTGVMRWWSWWSDGPFTIPTWMQYCDGWSKERMIEHTNQQNKWQIPDGQTTPRIYLLIIWLLNDWIINDYFQEFLRNLPDCLLMSHLYKEWILAAKITDIPTRLESFHRFDQLYSSYLLTFLFIYLLTYSQLVRHCDLVESARTWDGTGCEFDSCQCRIYTSYPMFIEPTITWVPSGFDLWVHSLAWHKNCVKKLQPHLQVYKAFTTAVSWVRWWTHSFLSSVWSKTR